MLRIAVRTYMRAFLKLLLPQWAFERVDTPGFKKYATNTGWLFFAKVGGAMISFFVNIFLARYLAPEGFGLLNYALSLSGLFVFLAGFGVENILARELISYPDKRDRILGTAFFLKVAGGALSFISLVLVAIFSHSDPLTSWLIVIISFSYLLQPFGVVDAYFQSQVASKNTVTVQLLTSLFSSVLKILLMVFQFGIIFFALLFVFESVFSTTGYIYKYRKQGLSFFHWKFEWSTARQMLSDSWPFMIGAVFYVLYMRIDQVMIKALLDDAAVGVYSAAVRLSEMWYFIPVAICSSLFPAIINARKTDKIMYYKRLGWLYGFMLLLGLVIAVPVFLLSGFIINLLYGAEYSGAIPVLSVYVWSIIPIFLSGVIDRYLVAENFTKIMFIGSMAGGILNVLLNFAFIPRYGPVGSAWATLVSYLCIPFCALFFKKVRRETTQILKTVLHIAV